MCTAKTLSRSNIPTISLVVDYASKYNKFAIVDKEGQLLWCGLSQDRTYNQAGGELNVAKKAIILADKIKEYHGLDRVNLILYTDFQSLCMVNFFGRHGKVSALKTMARRRNVALFVKWIESENNLADQHTRNKKYLHYTRSQYLQLIKKPY